MPSGHENFSSFFLYSGVLGHTPENTRCCCHRLRAMKPLFRDLKIQSTSPLCSWLDLYQSSFLNRVEAFNRFQRRQKQRKRLCLAAPVWMVKRSCRDFAIHDPMILNFRACVAGGRLHSNSARASDEALLAA